MPVNDWLIKIECEGAPSILAALHAVADKLKLTVVELKRDSGPTILITRRFRATFPDQFGIDMWSLDSEIRGKVGSDYRPIAIVAHPESETEPIPPIMSISEISKMLGVSRQRAQQLSRQPDFPQPIARTSNGPIYAISDIARYHHTRARKKGQDKNGHVALPEAIDVRRYR